ncbi:MAG: bacteriorhodopsin [Rubricoccaceae bacterium]
MPFETLLHWIYVAAMAAGALLFFVWMTQPRGVPRWEYLVAIFIPVWSGLAYMAMALDYGTTAVAGQVTYWARYADWVVTTPLLLVALWMTGTYSVKKHTHAALLVALVGADVIMILSGLVADLTVGDARYIFYFVGVAALLVIFYIVWVPLRRVASVQSPQIRRVYDIVAAYLSLFWIGYPLTWILGPSGLGLVSQQVDTLLFVVLPIFSKVGFSVVDLGLLRGLGPQTEAPAGGRLRPAGA